VLGQRLDGCYFPDFFATRRPKGPTGELELELELELAQTAGPAACMPWNKMPMHLDWVAPNTFYRRISATTEPGCVLCGCALIRV
jgi:hypothetical protein